MTMELFKTNEKASNEDDILERKIQLRDYQLSLLEQAKHSNSIIYLPAGAGKTVIAIHVLGSKTTEIIRPFHEGGKRAIFLTATKLMVHQTAKVLKTETKFKVTSCTGEMNVDCWNKEKWVYLLENTHVLVTTPEIVRVILQLNYISETQIAFLVLDECHHAVHNHPYNVILQHIAESGSSEKPLVLGLSSILINATPKLNRTESYLRKLENAIQGKIISGSNFPELMSFSANPKESIVTYKKNWITPLHTEIMIMFEKLIKTLGGISLRSSQSGVPEGATNLNSPDKLKRTKRAVVIAKSIFEEYDMFCGSLATLFVIILIERYRLISDKENEIQVLVYARTQLLKIRRVFQKYIGEEETIDGILRFSSNKVIKLVNILRQAKETNRDEPLNILIFAKQRLTAIILAFFLKRLKVAGDEFSFLKPDFIVGINNYAISTTVFEYSNEEILNKFASQALNVLVATNILEEGIDISSCNVVISFDFPPTYSSYFQSRGRARNKHSFYYLFVEESEAEEKTSVLENYRGIEKEITQNVGQRCIEWEDASSDDFLEKIILNTKSGPLCIDGITAIKIVNRYCSKLSQDKHALLSPITWYVGQGKNKQVFVQFPKNCPLQDIVEGEPKQSVKLSKRSAFLIAVKLLYDIGQLDENMNLNSYKFVEENYQYLFPHFKNETTEKGAPQAGTSKRKQKYKTKFAESLSGCLPKPGEKVYLHVINFSLDFDKPELERRVVVYETLKYSATFALLSSKKLCKILRFPVFLDIGQINCDLIVNYEELILTESQLNDIKQCHFALFQKVVSEEKTNVLKNPHIFDNRNKEHSFFIVPVEKNSEDRFVINWDLIRCDYCKNITSALMRYNPSSKRKKSNDSVSLRKFSRVLSKSDAVIPINFQDEEPMWEADEDFVENERPKFVMSEIDYEFFVIYPNYRNLENPQRYIVSKICKDMSPLSPFPKSIYEDYVAYYKHNYKIQVTNTEQPLLRVSPIYNCSNFNRPTFRNLNKRKGKSYEEHLLPELCDIISFDRKYYLKALLLPTVLNRIYHVYCVEEFRRKLVSEIGLGSIELPEETDWPPLESVYGLVLDEEENDENNSSKEGNRTLTLTQLKDETQVNNKSVLDPERHLFGVGLCDIEFCLRNVKDFGVESANEEFEVLMNQMENVKILELISRQHLPVPRLTFIQGRNKKNTLGPDLALLIQACTAKSSKDLINYERLEIVGDSFLKFATSIFLFRNFGENEGILTTLKGKIVGNRNLLYCGVEKGLQDIINMNDFTPLSDWNPPLIYIPEQLIDKIESNNLDPAVLSRYEIPFEEKFSGILSENTIQQNEELVENYEKCYDFSSNSLLPYKVISDKMISDCVEAFIGVYLHTYGMHGAFSFLSWLDVLPSKSGSYEELIEKPYENSVKHTEDAIVMNILSEVLYSELEKTLNYTFKNKALLLEAITHPSYSKNRITNCYERLELLGDSIIDFLITSYLYENCGNLSPGQVTDIRSSLVNNITFACLTARYEFHKYLLYFSSSLSKAIGHFVSFQESRNHVVDGNVLILLEENDYSLAETIEVPKALGDVFESLAGAIYLDSGNSLETVWRIYYILMKHEIDEFTKTVPKTPVRLLYEICGDKPYFESKLIPDGVVMSECIIYFQGEEIKAYGFGPNKKEAKKSAAKVVINKILQLKK